MSPDKKILFVDRKGPPSLIQKSGKGPLQTFLNLTHIGDWLGIPGYGQETIEEAAHALDESAEYINKKLQQGKKVRF